MKYITEYKKALLHEEELYKNWLSLTVGTVVFLKRKKCLFCEIFTFQISLVKEELFNKMKEDLITLVPFLLSDFFRMSACKYVYVCMCMKHFNAARKQ